MAERFEIVQKALVKMLEDKKYATLRDILVTMNPSDIAGLFEDLEDKEIPLMFREDQNHAAKRIIAKKASQLIHDGDVIFLDASSTASYLIPYLEKCKDIIVVTNSPKTSIRLGERKIKNYCTGGLLLMHSFAYVGSEAERFMESINADLFFFSSRGYTENGAITDSSEQEVAMKKAMLRSAQRSYYLCDSSKKGQKFAFNICSVKDIAGIIDES